MFSVSLTTFFLAMVTLGLILFVGLWWYHDRVSLRLYRNRQQSHAFNCVRCGALYSRQATQGKVPCPRCGFSNIRLRF